MFLLITFFVHFTLVHGVTIFPLSKFTWTVENLEGLVVDKISATIPTGIYTDLYKAGILKTNPIYGVNDVKYRWVANTKWMYSVEFPVDENVISASNVELTFHGLDGTAKILLNDQKIGETTNSFVRYRFDVKTLLVQNTNSLKIIFDSPLKTASEMAGKFKDYISQTRIDPRNEENVHFLRRMQASFGTDWSPTLPSVGIWKEVELTVYENDLIIRDIATNFTENFRYGNTLMEITVFYDLPLNFQSDITGEFELVLLLENNVSKKFLIETNIKANSQGNNTTEYTLILLSIFIAKEEYQLWWPNEYGKQHLYELKVSFRNKAAIITNTKSIKIGFRNIKIDRHNIWTRGAKSFYFEVNNVEINAKGANFLPIDILPEKSSNKETIKSLLLAAKTAHMNMLRVPAIGLYQSDYFYELCDEYGIMVWQDMMFYKELYPITSEHLISSLRVEISQQIMRLQHHPSIALWVSNSNILLTISNIMDNYKRKLKTNIFLEYSDTVQKQFNSFANILSLRSTPSDGEHEIDSRNININNPNSFQMGDAHITLKGNSWVVKTKGPKFVTQIELPSFPSLATLKHASTEIDDLSSISSNFMQGRQRRNEGDSITNILCSIAYHFGMPKDDDLENLIYASQINQAWSLKVQIENFRHVKTVFNVSDGSDYTKGILIWHLNDVWAALTSSSIEYGGKWKMLQYYARKFFDPLSSYLVILDEGEVDVYILSDLKDGITINVKLEVFKWTSLTPVYSLVKKSKKLDLKRSTFVIFKENQNIFKTNCNAEGIGKECFIKVTFTSDEDKDIYHNNYLLPSEISFKYIVDLPNPKIEATVKDCDTGKCTILVETDAVALFVWLEIENVAGYFSDNGFIMAEKQKVIEFYPQKEIPGDELMKLISLDVKVMDKNRLDQFDYVSNNFINNMCKNYY